RVRWRGDRSIDWSVWSWRSKPRDASAPSDSRSRPRTGAYGQVHPGRETAQAGARAVKIPLPFTVAVCLHLPVRAIGSQAVAAPRLLILADPKMLPALANGLREGGRFDVLPVPL